MNDRKKALELFAKQISEGLPFAEDFIQGDSDIENNSLMARNLSEDALAQQVLKNTGVPIPDKGAPLSKKEDFLNRIAVERYPEIKDPNIRIGAENSYTPSTGGILVKDTPDINKTVGKTLHETAHKYDNDILGFKGSELDLKTLRDAKKSGIDLKNMDPAQVYELYSKGHHADIPKLREGSFGLGALKSMMKSGTFKALPIIGGAATAAAALQSPDASAAVGDLAIPGGLESLGPSEEDASIENPQANPELRKQALMRLKRGR